MVHVFIFKPSFIVVSLTVEFRIYLRPFLATGPLKPWQKNLSSV